MPLNTNIAMSGQPVQIANPMEMYGKMASIQNAQNQNALAQYQLGSAQRAERSQNVLADAYAQATDPATGKIDYNKLTGLVAAGGGGAQLPGIQKSRLEYETAQTTQQKAQSDLLDAKLKQSRSFLDTIDLANPNAPAQYLAWHEANHKDPIIGAALAARGVSADQARQSIEAAIAKGPAAFANLVKQSMLGTEKFMEMNKPITVSPSGSLVGPSGNVIFTAPAAPAAPTDIAKLIKERDALPKGDPNRALYDKEIANRSAVAENARKRLEFDQNKFNWEKANPGFELKEADDGSVVGVNKRTLQAFPVTIGGGAAPAAAPAAGGTGMPSARVPAPQASLAGATPTAGKPLMGKGQAMTETQSNAATFGGAMMQAQSTINQLEKTGTVTNAVVPGLLTGLAKLVPLGVGENLGNVIQSTFNADPTGLIGPNANQQRLAQAQLAFSIAYLRKTSGAAFGATEVSNTIQEYFPVIGDSDQVIAQKAAARKRAIDGMRISTNAEGKKYIDSFKGGDTPAAGVDTSNPLLQTPR